MTEFLVLSPHLDDAVLSCGRLLARCRGSVVATLFTGGPSPALLTEWDRKCGFTDSDNAVAVRGREDRAALESLGSVPFHCEILDGQYGPGEGRQERLAAAIQSLVAEFRPAVLVTPLGLVHQDHFAVRTAVLAVIAPYFDGRWLIYEDLPYARQKKGAYKCARAHDEFVKAGVVLVAADVDMEPDFGAKLAAIRCYHSQLQALRYTSDAVLRKRFEVERYWCPAIGFSR